MALNLHQVLYALGFTTQPMNNYRRQVVDRRTGEVVFTGTAHQTWLWLRERQEKKNAN